MSKEIQMLEHDLIADVKLAGKKEVIIDMRGDSRAVTPSEFIELKRLLADATPEVTLSYRAA